MASSTTANVRIHRCGGGYISQKGAHSTHFHDHIGVGLSASRKSQSDKPPLKIKHPQPNKDNTLSFSRLDSQDIPFSAPNDGFPPSIRITASDLHLDLPDSMLSPSPKSASLVTPSSVTGRPKTAATGRPKTAATGRPKTAASTRSSSRQANRSRITSSGAIRNSPSRNGQNLPSRHDTRFGDYVKPVLDYVHPIPAWCSTEVVPDEDDSVLDDIQSDSPRPSEQLSTFTSQSPAEVDDSLVSQDQDEVSCLRRDDPIRRLIEGPQDDDNDYDTDLEEEYTPKTQIVYDPAGKNVYLAACQHEGVVASRYIVQHLHETEFRMRHRYFSAQTLVPLAKAFKSNTCTEMLDLCDNHLGGEGGAVIAYMMRDNCYITQLDVSENQLHSKGASGFALMLETNYTLKSLSLSANHLTARDALLLSEALKNNSTLVHLDLSHNDMGELAGVYLGSALMSNDALTYLDLKWNGVRGKGIISLANSLKVNTSLEVLDLSENNTTLPGCTALQQALRVNMGVKILDLSSNHINTPAVKKLALGLKKNTTLEALLLGGNPIGDEGTLALVKACPFSSNLKLLSLQGITMSLAVHLKVKEMEEACNVHVLCMDFSGHRKVQAASNLIAMVDQFLLSNQARLLHYCFTVDDERTWAVSAADLRRVLVRTGLDLSRDQIDTALHQAGILRSDSVPYRPMLAGLSALQQQASSV